MAQAGFTPIQLYFSSTASSAPIAGNLTNGELAINITDGKLFYKDNLGAIQVIGTKGGVGTSTNTQVLYNASGLVVGSANLLFDGTTLTAAGLAGPHNGTVGATTPSTGAFTTLSASSTVSGTGFSNYLASPPAIGGTAPAAGTFTTVKAIAAATQDAVNLQGRAGGSSSFGVTLTPTTLTGNRTLTLPDASGTVLQSGTAVTIAQGGTGQTTAISAFNALSPITSLGDLIIGNGSNSATRLAISPTAGDVLTSNGTTAVWAASTGGVTSVGATAPVASSGGSTPTISLNAGYGDTLNPYASKTANFVLAAPNGSAGVPTFRAIVAADIPTLNQNTTGTASNVTGTVATANGGTGLSGATPFTSGGVLYASSASALASSAALAANAMVVGGGAGSAPLTRSNITSDNSFLQLGASTPLRFADSDSSNYVSFQAPATITSNVAWTLPATDGGSGQFLSTNGSGTLSWATASGGGSPGGSSGYVQYNNGSGGFAGSANLTFNGTTLTAAGLAGPHDGTVGATTPSTGSFTTLAASSTVSGTGFSTYLASPPAIGGTAAAAGTFTAGSFSSTVHRGSASGTITITAPSAAGTQSYTLPSALPTANGQVLSCTTAGVMSWIDLVSTAFTVDSLVIAGGGGGTNGGNGGGAGGFVSTIGTTLNIATNYTVTVGAGGAGGTAGGTATPGSQSVFGGITATGGGSTGTSSGAGGSGAGGAYSSPVGPTGAGGLGTAGQGNNGGTGGGGGIYYCAGGGGGAGAVGGNASLTGGVGGANSAGAGGNGSASSITGTSVTYAGGGGGGSYNDGTAIRTTNAVGGTGGGGRGGSTGGGSGIANTPGSANTGGGGGANDRNLAPSSTANSAGGSGIVIIKYPDTKTITIGAGLTGSTATSGAFKITSFTAGTGTVSFA